VVEEIREELIGRCLFLVFQNALSVVSLCFLIEYVKIVEHIINVRLSQLSNDFSLRYRRILAPVFFCGKF
jgi:hypothetical protein